MCGFIAQLVEHRTGMADVTGSNPIEALLFFRLLLSNCLFWKIYCGGHSSLSFTILVARFTMSSLSKKENVVLLDLVKPFKYASIIFCFICTLTLSLMSGTVSLQQTFGPKSSWWSVCNAITEVTTRSV